MSDPRGVMRSRSRSEDEISGFYRKKDAFVVAVVEITDLLPQELYASATRALRSIRSTMIIRCMGDLRRLVPRDSGDLQRAMIRTLRYSYVSGNELVCYLGSVGRKTAKYMHYVNEGKNVWGHMRVAHHGYTRSRNKPYRRLYDPTAEINFIEKLGVIMWDILSRQVRVAINRLIQEYRAITGRRVRYGDAANWLWLRAPR